MLSLISSHQCLENIRIPDLDCPRENLLNSFSHNKVNSINFIGGVYQEVHLLVLYAENNNNSAYPLNSSIAVVKIAPQTNIIFFYVIPTDMKTNVPP